MSNRRKIKRKPQPTGDAIYYRDGSCIYGGVSWPSYKTTSAAQLWDRLVSDGVARIPTPLAWMVAAITKIAEARQVGREQVTVDLMEAVKDKVGMPLTIEPGST